MINKTLKKLPVGISSFERIINNNLLYIDKTELLYNLVNTEGYYFLSRPRRFGKSLLISTLFNIFKGNKELFKDFYIYNTDFKWGNHPIVKLDFNKTTNDSRELLENDLRKVLKNIGEKEGINIDEKLSLKLLFNELIEKLYQKYQKGVVFLIDEYDKPIIDHIGKGEEHLEIAKDNRDLLKSFYGTLKEGDVSDRTRFVFLTGVTKFSKVSIFSELNNLNDLTMDEGYWNILGITEEEIERELIPYIDIFCKNKGKDCKELREELRNYYNGYRFSDNPERVYNPFSLFSALTKQSIKNYWFETGTPTFLINLIKERGYEVSKFDEGIRLYEDDFTTFDIEMLSIESLLFQTGYLTINKIYEGDSWEDREYELSYPNREVEVSFIRSLYRGYEIEKNRDRRFKKVGEYFRKGEIDKGIEVIKSIYSEIPYTLMRKDRIGENYFHTVFYLIMKMSFGSTKSEVLNSKGIIDMLVETKDRYYIIEFKCNQSAERAIEQIKEKGYHKPYLNKGKEVILIGINFSTEKRNIARTITDIIESKW